MLHAGDALAYLMMQRATVSLLLAFACWGAHAAGTPPCTSEPRSKWMERKSIRDQVEALGYKVIEIEVENGCYAIEVRDKNGKELDLYLDPVTGKIVRREEDS
jgi:hypothetical protein